MIPFVRVLCFSCVALFWISARGSLALAQAPAAGQSAATQPVFPLQLSYTLPQAGNVVLAINDAAGHRVRNLVAEAPRSAGEHAESWDGLDDDGKPVPAGAYHFIAACVPTPKLTYEFTVYNSGHPPWWKQDVWEPRMDPGGWMSDHAPPNSAAAVGNLVFLGSESAEHGHAIIAVDLDGNKVWGAKWLELAGARWVCGDGKVAYSAGEGSWIGNRLKIFAIDSADFSVRKVVDLDFAASGRLGGLSGLAARDGLIYASFNPGHQDILSNTMDPAALDLENCSGANGLTARQLNALLRVAEPQQPWVNLPLTVPPKGEQPAFVRLAWKSPIHPGTILSPHRLEISALKPTAKYPGDINNDADWVAFNADLTSPTMKIYTATENAPTLALRIKVLNAVEPQHLDQPQAALGDSAQPAAAFIGMRSLRPCLRRVAAVPQVTVSSGKIVGVGAWENIQDADISEQNPALYTLSFPQPAVVGALIVRDPFFVHARVQVQTTSTGPWVNAGELNNTFYWRRAYSDLVCDFGPQMKVSALRIQVIEPAVAQNSDVKTRSGSAAKTCGLGGVILLQNDSPEPEFAPEEGQQITVFNAADGKIMRDLPLVAPGALAFDPSGRLLAVSAGRVVNVALPAGQNTPVITSGIQDPTGLACDSHGAIYVSDSGDNIVKRFTSEGQPAGTIGKPGGIMPGPYDPEHMSNPHGICIDPRGRLWVAEAEMRPKKVSVWSGIDGPSPKLEKYFIGGPRYGSGFMFIDPRQPTRFFMEGMEFSVDWDKGTSFIKNITWRDGRGDNWDGVTCDRPIYVHDKLYLVGEPFWFYGNQYFAIGRYQTDHTVPVAAGGLAEQWPPLQDPALRAALGNPDLDQYSFLWSDLNDDGKVEANEVKLSPKGVRLTPAYFGSWAGNDLTLQFTDERYTPTGYTPGGAPLYDFEHMTLLKLNSTERLYNTALTLDGRPIEISSRVAVYGPDGILQWSYPDRYSGVHGSMKAPPPEPGMLIGTLHVIGHAVLPELGEVFAVATNKGDICLFTADGLFVARLFHDNRYGKGFNFPDERRGMDVSDISINTEHFGGTFNQLADGRIYLVVGHNHSSVIRLDGLEGATRFAGNIDISPEQTQWAAQLARSQGSGNSAPQNLVIARSPGGIRIDANLDGWAKFKPIELHGTGAHQAKIWAIYDPQSLIIAADVHGQPGMVNHETDWKMLFKSGDCVDLQLRTKPEAAANPQVAEGDLRVIISMFNGQPAAVIYRPVVPDTAVDKKNTFASPVGSTVIDVIEKLDVPIDVAKRDDGYTLVAAIPWSVLGVKPVAGMKLSGDFGVLFGDRAGAVAERIYWSNKNSGLVSDVPGEARIAPSAWGMLQLQ